MDIKEIKENLCIYDVRNPDNNPDCFPEWMKKDPCYCDNCFQGRNFLANELLKLMKRLNTCL